tara:strand:+ start:72 stop:275 length:204 start_codon:yes stop_codon:yes gene_type:complete
MEQTNKILTEFRNDVAGCIQAKQYLISIGKWSPDVERRDGWEIVHIANLEIRRHNQRNVGWHPYDDI